MAVDPMDEIKRKVDREYKAFDAVRQKLVAQYRKAKTPKKRLYALVTLMRQHAEYVGHNVLCSGWQTDVAFSQFAEQIESIADEL